MHVLWGPKHYAASCPTKLTTASGPVKINAFQDNLGKEMDNQDQGKGKKMESGNV
jgi:hypothetical protein